ncbi:hypothetical protein D3C85_1467020 [compost metagenome]
MAAGFHADVQGQAVAADHPAGRVQQVDVAGRAFRVERPLHGERAVMAAAGQHRARAAPFEAQRQLGAPAVVVFEDRLHQRATPIAITSAAAAVRVSTPSFT